MRFLLVSLLVLLLVPPLACTAEDRSAAAVTEPESAAPTADHGTVAPGVSSQQQQPGEPPPPGQEPPTGRGDGEAATGKARPDVPRPPSAPAPTGPAPSAPSDLSAHRLAYLEESAGQMRRLERAIGEIGSTRLGSGALAAAALAANGREGWREPAAQWTRRAIESCAGNWHDLDCELVMMDLQRIVLQFPDALSPRLLRRVREVASQPAPPPDASLIRDPWSFHRTENQQIGLTARALGAHAVAGNGDSPAARAWSRYAEAFLRAHDRDGWYEWESPGYMGTSVTALLYLADHAPDRRVRDLATRQLQLLFAAWAENQVNGTPAGPRSRTYVHWAQGTRNTPWRAWAWYFAGLGGSGSKPGNDVPVGDWPQIATAGYEVPEPLAELLRTARSGDPYEVRGRRTIRMDRRRNLDAATYSWVTPDYVLSSAPAVEGLELGVSGGQEIQVTLFAEGSEFAPLYLWSRVQASRSQRWRSRSAQEKAVSWRNLAVARMGTPREPGHAWLAAPWSRPQAVSDSVLVSRYGDTFVALVAVGGWEVTAAGERFPEFYGSKSFAGSWLAVPKRQPAVMGLEVARASELRGDAEPWEAWRQWAERLSLEVTEAEGGGDLLTLRSTSGRRLAFRPGESATVDGSPLRPSTWEVRASPHLRREASGAWRFEGGGADYRFPPLAGPSEVAVPEVADPEVADPEVPDPAGTRPGVTGPPAPGGG